MRKPEKCVIEYYGYKTPKTPDELEMEVLGLHNLIKSAEAKISSLVQSRFYAEAMLRSEPPDDSHLSSEITDE